MRLGAFVLLAWVGTGALVTVAATWPRCRPIAARATLAGRAVEHVALCAADGVGLRGWLVSPGAPGQRAVVLCAGIGGNREAMVSRAAHYLDRGWAALLVDLRGTGASDAARITMGWDEALDLAACHELLRGRGYTVVGVHGQSLGAAAAAFTAVRSPEPTPWDFVVLEACYRDITSALTVRMSDAPEWLCWPILAAGHWLFGLDPAALDAVAALRRLTAPTLIACGVHDRLVGPEATDLLFAASAAEDKVRHDVPGVGHRDLWFHGGAEFRAALDRFLERR